MLPKGYQVAPSSDPSLTATAKGGDDRPFLVLQTSSSDPLTVQLPALLRADMAPVADHTTTVQVWSYTPLTEQVSRVALDSCKVTSGWARPDLGWPFMASVYVHTKGRNYQFSFFTADANSPVVKQVLDSAALSCPCEQRGALGESRRGVRHRRAQVRARTGTRRRLRRAHRGRTS